jgi:hypothetical protein
MLTRPTYVNRETVASALDAAETWRAADRIDRAIETATLMVEGLLRRRFIPTLDTRYFDWPNRASPTPWRLWLDYDEVISVTSVVAGGVTLPLASLFLEPVNLGPPYTYIETSLATSATFQAGQTRQRAVAISGLFGFQDEAETVGQLAGPLGGTTGSTASVIWTTPRIGVGDLLKIDAERVLVTDRNLVDSTQTLQTPLSKSAADVTVAVSDGTAFAAEETILLDAERMRVIDVAGNNLVVKRAFDGSVLAAHTGSKIYTLTGVTLGRSQAGTTIASHLQAAPITRLVIPGVVRDLALAYALNQLEQESTGYARTAGTESQARVPTGKGSMVLTGRGVSEIEAAALDVCGRQMLTRAV